MPATSPLSLVSRTAVVVSVALGLAVSATTSASATVRTTTDTVAPTTGSLVAPVTVSSLRQHVTEVRRARRFTGPASLLPPAPSPVATTAPVLAGGADNGTTGVRSRSAARGPDAFYVPEGDLLVPVGSLTQTLLDSRPEGTRFVLAAGIHRLTGPLTPRPRQQLLGHYGAVLSGAKPLIRWVASGGAWYIDGQTQRLPVKDAGRDVCVDGALCHAAEDVFVDDVSLRQVATRAELRPGSFWFDTATDRIYLGEDPSGRRVETTAVPYALVGAREVVLRNLVIEKFGNPFQSGAVSGEDLSILNCRVRLNHGGGVFSYGGELRRNVIEHNGQIGLGGGGTGQTVEDNEISFNNTQGFDPGWEAGGTKFAFTTDLVVRGNWVHSNQGNGLWTDIDNIGTLYEDNLVEDNTGIGIFHEISYRAVIRNNVVRRNGTRSATFNGRVGINITNSPDVQVLGNTVEDNAGGPILAVQDTRGSNGRHGPRELRNLLVSGNTMRGGGYRGVWVYDAVTDRAGYYTTRSLVFRDNRYALPSLTTKLFLGGDAGLDAGWDKTWSQWRALGQDSGSTLL